jgi:DNA adenine methylase
VKAPNLSLAGIGRQPGRTQTNLQRRQPEAQEQSTAELPLKSPLRYAGGKTRAVPMLLSLLPDTPGDLVSPFFGGGSLELAACARGWRVHGADALEPLVLFWQEALTDAVDLADAAATEFPLTRDRFRELQDIAADGSRSSFERAAAFFVCNRASFSGTTLSGGMSRHAGRFTPSSINRLRRFAIDDLWVEHADFRATIEKATPDAWLFLDPPYWSAERLYGVRGDLHTNFDHEGLREMLESRHRFLLCYDDCPAVRRLYRGFQIRSLAWKYGMSADKSSREIVIRGAVGGGAACRRPPPSR